MDKVKLTKDQEEALKQFLKMYANDVEEVIFKRLSNPELYGEFEIINMDHLTPKEFILAAYGHYEVVGG